MNIINDVDPILGLAMMSGILYLNQDDTEVLAHVIESTVFDVLVIGGLSVDFENFYTSYDNVKIGSMADMGFTEYVSVVVIHDDVNDATKLLLGQVCANRGLKLIFVSSITSLD